MKDNDSHEGTGAVAVTIASLSKTPSRWCGGRTITEVARDLGVSKWSLGRWVQRAKAGQTLSESKTLAQETPEQRELRRLRQELEYVSRQRDILKKACGILSAEMPPLASR